MTGFVLNYKTVKQIYEYGAENLKLDEIMKLSKINEKKVNVKKKEFTQIINVLGKLIEQHAFEKIDDSQLFFINLKNSIAEFDIITILKEGDKNLILNIEVKTCDDEETRNEIERKLSEQLEKRLEDHLQQMFINDEFMVLGYINDKFMKGIKAGILIDENSSVEILKNLKNNIQSYSKIQISDNLSNIQSVYSKLKNNSFKMYRDNVRVLSDIENYINSGKKVIMCLAKPGYGKTVLALSLFFNNNDSKILILNQKFYNTFYMSEYYNSSKAFFGTDAYINQINPHTIAIIDEAQRLAERDLIKIINKARCVIIFGDTGQAFMETDEFIDEELYEQVVAENVGENYAKIRLKKSIRYSKEVDLALKYIYDKRSQKDDLRKVSGFKINIFNVKEEFIKNYNVIAESKKIFKMYTSISLSNIIESKIGKDTFSFTMADRDYWNFAISGNEPKFGHTLHAISFDIENVFLYLDNLIFSEYRKMPIPNNIDERDDIAYRKYINELDILLTRAKKSLNIYVDDLRSYLWFNEKITDINNASVLLDD